MGTPYVTGDGGVDDAVAKALLAEMAAMREELREHRQGRPELGHDLTVARLYELYDEGPLASLAAAYDTRLTLKSWIKKFGDRLVYSLRTSEVTGFRDGERATYVTQNGRPPAPRTRNLEVTRFMALLNWGVADRHLARNPIDKIKKLPVQDIETTISRDDQRKVMRATDTVLRAMFALGLCGMRLNEIRLLEWGWVDLDARRLHLPAWVTKTRTARVVALRARAVDALREMPRQLHSQYVFTSPRSSAGDYKPFCRSVIGQWWRQARAELGLKPAPGDRAVTFHATRHTAATEIANARGLKVAMKQLGQTSVQVALKYQHADASDLDAMAAHLDEMERESLRPERRLARRDGENQ